MVSLTEAKSYIGKVCAIDWLDRSGQEQRTVSTIHDATFVPLYGAYLVTDRDDIRLDRVSSLCPQGEVGTIELSGAAERRAA